MGDLAQAWALRLRSQRDLLQLGGVSKRGSNFALGRCETHMGAPRVGRRRTLGGTAPRGGRLASSRVHAI